jgi:hypothetical protein
MDAPALRRVGLLHLAGGDSPRGSSWNGCGLVIDSIIRTCCRTHCAIRSMPTRSYRLFVRLLPGIVR